MAASLKSFLARLSTDDPETNGPRLWVMFAISLLLVATLNWYAMVREPSVVDVDDLTEYVNEVVKVEGTLISWVEDPYNSGDDRLDAIIDDGTGVVELRWYRPGDTPPIGTNVTIIGDVINYEGRMWIQALGAGAMSWKSSDIPDVPILAISDVAINPEAFDGEIIQLTGFISKSLAPDIAFGNAKLGDHPNYGNSEHQIGMTIHSSTGQWIEAGSKVTVQGVLSYQQRELRWNLGVQGPEIMVDRNHPIDIPLLDWSSQSTWMYQSGRTVDVAGMLSIDNSTWELTGSAGSPLCVIPSDDDKSMAETWEGKAIKMRGRLVWNTAISSWCLDKAGDSSESLTATSTINDLLLMLSANPIAALSDSDTHYTVAAYMKYAVEPSVEDESGYFADSAGYTPGWTSIAVTIPGPRSTWLEAGQAVVADVTVSWDDENMRAELLIHDLSEGEKMNPTTLLWSDGATQWGYDKNKVVRLNGLAVEENGTWFLSEPGSEKKVRLNALGNSIGLDELHLGIAMTWEGRLLQIEDSQSMAVIYALESADVDDRDNDGLSDTLENAFGTSSYSEDSDGDGTSDRQEYIDQQ
ncbi:hypothetical protein N9M06_01175 [Candidatus Poseidoniales archaeon]|nr:hypothetical protein [Candidatus Poseidoniales archaeon]MDA8715735.1 hypothetical protein [Candidatus Poseidoniales archaeon]MDA8718083.1 hypothetical protein [Candidatus Poseidoniales archaeon]MDC0285595.1 hypothetical protein [Candidatus Poseidoniaceae archaeon]|tara:strand:- start:549 stop:2291 length:1743 start_codon:yes stop_codon:yes gene_type:complete